MALSEWMGFPVAAETRNFLITYGFPLSSGQADPGGASIAAALGSTCESDFSRLQDIFGVDFGVGGRNEHTVWVHVSSPGQGTGASNPGWSQDESSRIAIMGRRSGAVAD